MEFRTISGKMPVDEFSRVTDYCKRRGTSVSSLVRELLLAQVDATPIAWIAGKSSFSYDRRRDRFSWEVELDDGLKATVLDDMSPFLLADMAHAIATCMTERDEALHKKKSSSVAIPRKLIGGRK